eukprot:COSAG01_NODE_2394_length_7772_cov_153.097615_2_plen_59_part_00
MEARYYYQYYQYQCTDLTFCLYRCRYMYGTSTWYQRGGLQYGPVSGMHVRSHWLLDQA